ncbi:outer membrane protein [Methyloferula stellata]|uniref:outer membrane protein n=1 Tax=Methyloferula stellata TaxID=876270 RepID=UPI00059175AD|nr:outer membrane protein [Methyloferula stellata]
MNNEKTLSALVLAIAVGAAHAADLPPRRPAPIYVPPLFTWTGFYAGLNVGGGFSTSNGLNSYLGTNSGRASGFVAGGQAGYNYQVSPLFVVGVENDFLVTGVSTHNSGWNAPDVRVPFFGTARGRAGFTLLDSHVLVYGTGGLATGQVNDTGINKLRIGWTAGGGVEWAFLPNWSMKLEYLYTDLYKNLKSDSLPERHEKFHIVRVGVNYHFDLFKPASLGDRY